MTLTGRAPFQKTPKERKDPARLAEVAGRACCICEAYGMTQSSPTQVHHAIMGRGGNRRTPDSQTLPLCEGHHQGNFDGSKIAIHREPKLWREEYGPDTDYVV